MTNAWTERIAELEAKLAVLEAENRRMREVAEDIIGTAYCIARLGERLESSEARVRELEGELAEAREALMAGKEEGSK